VPVVVPPFVQYQAPLFPLRGLWNRRPDEGDKFVNIEIDWQAGGGANNAVQVALSGNSPVAFSQIVALSVDNGRCSVDTHFIFPDSGFQLTVPSFVQGNFPVFTNALMFYVSAPNAGAGDVTLCEVFNSQPPPVVLPTDLNQQFSAVAIAGLGVGSTQIIPAGVKNGVVENIEMSVSLLAAGTANVILIDGLGSIIWRGLLQAPAAIPTFQLSVPGIQVRFANGLSFQVQTSTLATSGIAINVYYTSVPGAG
jgi:hypothetical protein